MTVLLIHLVATVFMAGVIVFVQVVHYPLMADVGASAFIKYEAGHTYRTGLVVGVPMLVELATAIWILFTDLPDDRLLLGMVGLALLALIWISTALLQVPAHTRLGQGWDAASHGRLVSTNWIRTVAWLARVPIAVALLS